MYPSVKSDSGTDVLWRAVFMARWEDWLPGGEAWCPVRHTGQYTGRQSINWSYTSRHDQPLTNGSDVLYLHWGRLPHCLTVHMPLPVPVHLYVITGAPAHLRGYFQSCESFKRKMLLKYLADLFTCSLCWAYKGKNVNLLWNLQGIRK